MKQLLQAFLIIFWILCLYDAVRVLNLVNDGEDINIMVIDLYCQAVACADTSGYMSEN